MQGDKLGSIDQIIERSSFFCMPPTIFLPVLYLGKFFPVKLTQIEIYLLQAKRAKFSEFVKAILCTLNSIGEFWYQIGKFF